MTVNPPPMLILEIKQATAARASTSLVGVYPLLMRSMPPTAVILENSLTGPSKHIQHSLCDCEASTNVDTGDEAGNGS